MKRAIPQTLPVDRLTLRRLAVQADVDPRSVAKRLRGEPVIGRAGERIDRVLRLRGLLPADGRAA